jgi:pilus assembly protein Flp/PilA
VKVPHEHRARGKSLRRAEPIVPVVHGVPDDHISLRDFFRREDEGATAVEYAVMLALIIAVCIVAVGGLGLASRDMWNDNGTRLQSAFN